MPEAWQQYARRHSVKIDQYDVWQPEASLLRAAGNAAIAAALRQLSGRQREAVTLHIVAGVSRAEVARMLGVSESRVSQLIAAELLALPELFQDRPVADV